MVERSIAGPAEKASYNTLNLFVRQGILKVVTIKEHRTRYDYYTVLQVHFRCQECGEIKPDLPRLQALCSHISSFRQAETPYRVGTKIAAAWGIPNGSRKAPFVGCLRLIEWYRYCHYSS